MRATEKTQFLQKNLSGSALVCGCESGEGNKGHSEQERGENNEDLRNNPDRSRSRHTRN
jgi:hypothetical protein